MTQRTVLHVLPVGNGWEVRKEVDGEHLEVRDTKDDALRAANALAKQLDLSQVIVHKADGRIETEYTFGDG